MELEKKAMTFLGIRVYAKDKERWHRIVKRSNKSAREIFSEMLNMYERQMIIWDTE